MKSSYEPLCIPGLALLFAFSLPTILPLLHTIALSAKQHSPNSHQARRVVRAQCRFVPPPEVNQVLPAPLPEPLGRVVALLAAADDRLTQSGAERERRRGARQAQLAVEGGPRGNLQ